MLINATTWEELEDAFFGALELPSTERSAFLDRACAGNAALRAEVEAVLAAHESVGGGSNPDHLLTLETLPLEVERLEGIQVGAYRLGELVGHGGMGEVYRATRADQHFEQEVAIKLVRTEQRAGLMHRFLVERQVLARLQHPNIATLLDGGMTERGQPYLVMQFVAGVAITEYAVARQLTIRQRLQLFYTVCRAVQFAHANLIVHRDLKPSNILVTENGEVKLLDFGIAKLLAPDNVGVAAPMTGEALLLTPEYAAPEQFLSQPITTATDVYALGVLLYELVAGSRPFRDEPRLQLPRFVCEVDPAAPSTLNASVAGDLDQIILMALRKDPARRYASAGQLAEDVERYLAGHPVIARPDTMLYRVRKFVGRHRVSVAGAAVAAMLLIATTITATYQSQQRARALAQAEIQRNQASRLADFMLSVFNASNPSEARGRTITARELLDQAAGRIDRDLNDTPLAHADMALAIGQAYSALGLYAPATLQFDSVLAIRRRELPPDSPDLATALIWVARMRATLNKPVEAMQLAQTALDIKAKALGPNDTSLASVLTLMARLQYSLDPRDTAGIAARRLDRSLEILRAATPVDGRALASTLRTMGLLHLDDGHGDQSILRFREAIEAARSNVKEDDPFVFNLWEDLALGYQSIGQLDSAVAINRRMLDARIRVLGPDHLDVSYGYYNLARSTGRSGRWKEALPLFQRALDIRAKAVGADNATVGSVLQSYAIACMQAGQVADGLVLFQRAVQVYEKSLGERHSATLDALEGLAIGQLLAGQTDAGLRTLETAINRGYNRAARLKQAPFDKLAGNPRLQRLIARSSSMVP